MIDPFNPLSLWPMRFAGIDIIESPDRPRYELPERLRLPCGVDIEWPPGFRDDFNRWSLSFLGTVNMLPCGMIYMFGHRAVMRPEDVVRITNLC